jgi:O-methyltransferase involved in polyketide biosynthesis
LRTSITEIEESIVSIAEPGDLPPSVDTNRPNAARAYDYLLGGAHNFAADRGFAEQVLAIAPSIPAVTRLNRTFLRRVVRYFLDHGIRQFLDLGSGIPTEGNTHQVAQDAGVPVRVVYVDREPVAYYHAQQMLEEQDTAAIVQADMRDLPAVLEHPDTRRLLDFSEPVGLLVVGVLLYLPDPEPAELIRAYRERLAPGSLVAVSTLTEEHAGPELRAEMGRLRAAYEQAGEPVYPRNHAEILSWFDGLDVAEPGLVTLPEWHSQDPEELQDTARPLGYGAVARVREH